ncbi:lymphocyte-specific helicase [Octopus bimaculoides]|nr:lymphocyte-specific helicase [Octopus bimaculoides]|eukprot:XP_014788217.1 PREDICTED: lymphocyte-specific helicase-like [Octopus bimaculoides]
MPNISQPVSMMHPSPAASTEEEDVGKGTNIPAEAVTEVKIRLEEKEDDGSGGGHIAMEKKSVSPSKPLNVAVEPSEDAHMSLKLNGTPDCDNDNTSNSIEDKISPKKETKCPLTDGSDMSSEKNPQEETVKETVTKETNTSVMITADMMKEEQLLQQDSIEAEQKLKEEQEECWSQMNEMARKVRYQRLQILLDKSNAYTQYLLGRIKKQEKEEEHRRKMVAKLIQKRHREKAQRVNGPNAKESEEESEVNENDTNSTSAKKRLAGSPDQNKDAKRPKLSDTAESCSSDATIDQVIKTEDETTDDISKMNMLLNEEDIALAERTFNGQLLPLNQPKLLVGGVLRPYQMDGYNWLKMLYENGVNGILADEMGLGKTIQCIALVCHLVSMGVSGPYLVCAPLSTLPNWVSEFKQFAPQIPVVLYHGDRATRSALRQKLLTEKKLDENTYILPVVVTSYQIIMNDRKLLSHINWKYLIIDEGQRIKNTHCRLISELRLYNTTHRLLLTGTPLQNCLSELWSLLNFLLPELFDDLRSFESWFDIERIGQENADEEIVASEEKDHILSMLHQILIPFMLRRLKSDVELVIPPKKEVLVFCPLSKLQQTFYKATLDNTIEDLLYKKEKDKEKIKVNQNGRPVRQSNGKKTEERDDKSTSLSDSRINLKMNNIMMILRKICNHPYLIEHPLDSKTGELALDEGLVKNSGKIAMLDCMLPVLKKNGHKVLIFSQFVQVLNILEDYCYLRDFEYCRLDGSMNFEERQEQMDCFNNDKEVFLFLLSTRAGGLGVNLVSADTVIIFDSDWNPQCDLQAQDRCHRIGQVKPVVVYRLVSRNTIDQRIVERATAKRKLEKMIIHQGKFKSGIKNFSTSLSAISPQELKELLQSSEHEEIYEGKNSSSVISKADLQKLLDRSDFLDKLPQKKTGHKKPNETCKEVAGVFKVIETEENSSNLSNIIDLKNKVLDTEVC